MRTLVSVASGPRRQRPCRGSARSLWGRTSRAVLAPRCWCERGTRFATRGEAVAAAAADTKEQAESAAACIEVDYQPLPVVLDVREAIQPGAPAVHDASEDPKLPNVCDVAEVKRGDVQAGFAASDRIFEETYETPWVHQGFLEPHVSLASVDPGTGRTRVWTSTQAQFNQREEIADILGLAMSQLRIIGLPVGGAFGGKNAICVEPICAALARRSGRPVKMVVSRRDDFYATRVCGGAVLELKTGVKRDGTILALQARLLFDTGAHPGAQHGTGAVLVQGPYRIPNLAVKAYAIYTNKPPAGSRRALTSPHVHFAIDSQMDIMAEALSQDLKASADKIEISGGRVSVAGRNRRSYDRLSGRHRWPGRAVGPAFWDRGCGAGGRSGG